ncbi:winged helix-turn-helix domain-containing protein [Sphingomonas qomolangmaensis]|uniref:Response regulator transcription factor n=1 Tax=Sphingomonas qomolangmaensis TaxID=2918765 RepID=A0ABY5LEM3_9SPHN|nr:response regulator transcription factor [Sphingomonas qomolangmaensis]UUL83161.1 response regulator transcription factor [Sphingomonas qomolangmaensis]
MMLAKNPLAAPINGARIAIVSPDRNRYAKLSVQLAAAGFAVDYLPPTPSTVRTLASSTPPLVVLDHPGPGTAMTRALQSIRGSLSQPSVIVLSPVGDLGSRIACLELGADDCVGKSCSDRELYARINAIWRRRTPIAGAAVRQAGKIGRFSRWEIDFIEQLMKRDTVIRRDFTPLDFRLLSVLLRHAQKVVDRTVFFDALGITDAERRKRSIDVAISRLRKKLEAEGEEVIRTVHRRGYLFLPIVQWTA